MLCSNLLILFLYLLPFLHSVADIIDRHGLLLDILVVIIRICCTHLIKADLSFIDWAAVDDCYSQEYHLRLIEAPLGEVELGGFW